MDNKAEFLYEAFNIHYNRGVAARENGNIKEARRELLTAAETLSKLADLSTGELKNARKERVMRLLEIVENLEEADDTPAPTMRKPDAPGPGAGAAKGKGGQSRGGRTQESTETQWVSAEIPDVTFADIAGLDDVKLAIRQRIINPRLHPDFYQAFDKKAGGGVLMYGLPGTGKTMIAKAIAAEVGCKFYSVRCSDIVSKWFGEAERNIKNLFETARADGEAIIFMDEFEAIGARRTGSESATNRLVPELLTQIQGFGGGSGMLMVIAATNRPWDIDSAFMRPGRLTQRLYIPLPDEKARQFLIEKAFRKAPVSPDVDIADLVYSTEGYTPADIIELCEACKVRPIDRAIAKNSLDGEMITPEDIEAAKKTVKSSVQHNDVVLLEKFERGELT